MRRADVPAVRSHVTSALAERGWDVRTADAGAGPDLVARGPAGDHYLVEFASGDEPARFAEVSRVRELARAAGEEVVPVLVTDRPVRVAVRETADDSGVVVLAVRENAIAAAVVSYLLDPTRSLLEDDGPAADETAVDGETESVDERFRRRYSVDLTDAVSLLYTGALYLTRGGRIDAAELVNDFVEKLLTREAPSGSVVDPPAYLRAGLARHFIGAMRRDERRWRELGREVPDRPTEMGDPVRLVENNELWELVDRFTGPDDARLLRMYFVDGRPYDEIARLVAMPPSTVGARIRAAVRRLRARLST